jgi:drug/metabolite transporter (DMT)-like permease
VPPAAWGAVAYAGLAAMVVAYLFYYRGVRVLGPVRTAMYSNLQPLIAMAVAFLTLREVPTIWQLGGAAAITSGLLVSRK